MAKSRQIAKKKPKWLQKIDAENMDASNRAYEAFCQFVGAKIDFELAIDEINEKFGSKYNPQDMFAITQEQEQQALDMLEGYDESDD